MLLQTIQRNWARIKDVAGAIDGSTVFVPVVLVMAAISASSVAMAALQTNIPLSLDVAGGPVNDLSSTNIASEAALWNNVGPGEDWTMATADDEIGSIIINDSAMLNANNPLSGVVTNRNGLVYYRVQAGDTLSKIAANFGVSLNTLYWANKGIESRALKLGQEITILPISGIIHEVRGGETLDSIAALYEVSEARLIKFNKATINEGLAMGTKIIVPDAKPKNDLSAPISSRLPNFVNYYALPTTGWNWGRLHNNNAVDIANACGTPIYASAEGLATEAVASGWNEGYGGYLLIEHPNGTKTRYAHTSRNAASVGDYVVQGDTVAYIGNTGNTHGPTGCHLHFEIIGAVNPFAK